MKKSQLLGAVSALPFLAMIISANADLIGIDNPAVTWTGQSHALTFAGSPLSTSDTALASDMLGDSGQIQPDENLNHFIDGALLASSDTASKIKPHTNSHMDIWLLLIVAAVVGTLSEIFHRRSFNR
jgi:hypothetical protein